MILGIKARVIVVEYVLHIDYNLDRHSAEPDLPL